MNLGDLGWNDAFEAAFAPHRPAGLVPGRVSIPHRGVCWVYTEAGELEAATAGRLRRTVEGAGGLPAAGDWVALTPPSGSGRGRIEAVLPRVSAFSRKVPGKANEQQVVAANVDTVFVVTGVGRDLNLNRLERYLALVWQSGARPVVVVTKRDLDPSPSATAEVVSRVAVGVDVHQVSGTTAEGVDGLRPYLGHGRTVALLGSSGVGKSTLINALLGEARQKVSEVGAFGKGRHTTSQRELILVPSGGLLLDTPGMREIQIWDAGAGIDEAFADIESLAEGCRFADCRHDGEPDCAVLAACESGTLASERLQSFRKLRAEQRFRESQLDPRAQAEVRRTHRSMQRALRVHLEGKYGGKS